MIKKTILWAMVIHVLIHVHVLWPRFSVLWQDKSGQNQTIAI